MSTTVTPRTRGLVKDLLKRIVLLSREHYDPDYLRQAARRELAKNKDLNDEESVLHAIAYGRWMVREEQGRNRVKRYRYLRSRYDAGSQGGGAVYTPFDAGAEIVRINRGADD